MKAVTGFLVALLVAGTCAAQDRNAAVSMEMDSGLPLHTVYMPRDMQEKLGIVVWGNGGCLNDGGNYRDLLSEVAARGFLVIANGAMNPPELTNGTSAEQLTQAIDWAIAENARPDGKLAGKLDTAQVALMGHSCGGRQALNVSGDPRIKTSVIVSAGGSAPDTLAKLHAPTLYFSGGASDRASADVESDFNRIAGVPLMKVSLDVGHNGTLFEEAGGAFGRVISAWLTWRLKGSADGAKWFVGPACMLCTVPAWTLGKKGID